MLIENVKNVGNNLRRIFMNLFGSKDAKTNPINQLKNVSSPIQPNEVENINLVSESSGVKPVELDDFFEFLDSKTIQKIIETPAEARARITQDVAQMEYETDGARAILNSLG